ncbi:protein kinase [Microcoleus sp. FACHB-831]|uniref:serine/threonine-protein kinase n=1 Tax=Microcoleus sp. FACHB-831 TaxID=2692827 RepID=UPI00168951CE|nr:serine/threonine-protein kinase [Microcoleus sp. FACHB-831]MBD1921128.1 protein kinase [Microcoleus sp. FACHB-831]
MLLNNTVNMIHPGTLLQERYRVIKSLGKGGFAEIFEVCEFGTPKVLKILLRNSSKHISLFEREAEALKLLRHPGIPRVQPDGDFIWKDEANKLWHCIVMEKIDGCNLEEWQSGRNNQSITQEQAFDWLKQLVGIIECIHKQQYIHRDIKPSNIMLQPDGKLVLIDFGAVRLITDTYLINIASRCGVTRIGTSGYTPPEQFDGVALPQSDFFALGRTFVHLLTGKHPSELMDYHTGEFNWRENAPQISPRFADLIDLLMASLPGQRPQNTEIIGQCLEAIADCKAIGIITELSLTESGRQDAHTTKIKSIKLKIGVAASMVLGLTGLWFSSPQMAVVFNDIGVENHLQDRLGTAEGFYKSALLLNPNYGKAHYNRGSLYEKQGKLQDARTEYEKSIKLSNFGKAYNKLGRLETLEGNYGVAVEVLKEGLQVTTDNKVKEDLLKNLNKALMERDRYERKGN